MANLNLLDLARLKGNDEAVGLIEENLTFAPEIATIPARTIRGTSYKTLIRTANPTVAFRNANEGVTAGKSTFINKLVETFILESLIQVDEAIAKANEDGVAALQALEASGVMKQALIELGSQIFYGVSVDSKGFPGLEATVDSDLVQDAGGTTATTGSSVYGVSLGAQGVQMIFGNDSAIDLSEWRKQSLISSGTNYYTALTANLNAWVGMQTVNKYSISRLRDITQAEAAARLNDTHIGLLLERYPIGHRPDVFFMNRRSRRQLQESRSVVTTTAGAVKDGPKSKGSNLNAAPLPEESHGIPIVTTDSLTSVEALS